MQETEQKKLARELADCVDVMPKSLKEVQEAVYNACLDSMYQTTRNRVDKSTEQLIEEAVKEFDLKFSVLVAEHPDGSTTRKVLPTEELEWFRNILSTIASKSAETERNRIVGEMKMGLLGIITSVGYSMKLSGGQVTVLNRQINDLLKALENNEK